MREFSSHNSKDIVNDLSLERLTNSQLNLLGVLYGLTAIGPSAVAVVLPELSLALGLDVSGTTWTFSAFGLGIAITTAWFGRLGDARGQQTPLTLGVLAMASGALIAAFAPSLGWLIAGRLLQGAGAGSIPALVPAIVAVRCPSDQRRAMALGRIAAITVSFAALGPLLGAAASAALDWRAAVALPALGVLLIPAARRVSMAAGTGERVDGRGAVLLAISAAAVILALQGAAIGMAAVTTGIGLATIAIPLLIVHVGRCPGGFIPKDVISKHALIGSSLVGAVLAAVYAAVLFAAPIHLSESNGFSTLEIGLTLAPAAAAGPLVKIAARRLLLRLDGTRIAAVGTCCSMTGAVIVAAFAHSPAAQSVGLAGAVAGYTLAQPALLDRISKVLAPSRLGTAIGLFNLVFFFGSAGGSALLGGIGLEPALLVIAGLASIAAFRLVTTERSPLEHQRVSK